MKGIDLDQVWRITENVIYIAVGLLLTATAIVVLSEAAKGFVISIFEGTLAQQVLQILDSLLVVLMIVEILHTVGISIRQHELSGEPFLIVGLIATVRRILIITAEQSRLLLEGKSEMFRLVLLELGVLTFMVLVIVLSLYILRRRAAKT